MSNYIILNSNNDSMNWFNIIFHNDLNHTDANWSNVHQNIYYKIDLEGKSNEEWQSVTAEDTGWEELYTYFNTGEYKNTLYGYNLSIKDFAAVGDIYNAGNVLVPENNYFTLEYESSVNISDIYNNIHGYKTEEGQSVAFDDMSAAALLKIINNLQSEISKWKNSISLDNYHWHGGDELSSYIDSLDHVTNDDLTQALTTHAEEPTSYITYDYAKISYVSIDDYTNRVNNIEDSIDAKISDAITANNGQIYDDLENSYVKINNLNNLVQHQSLAGYVKTSDLDSTIESLRTGFISQETLNDYVKIPEEGKTYILSNNFEDTVNNINNRIDQLATGGQVELDDYLKIEDADIYLTGEVAKTSYITYEYAEASYAVKPPEGKRYVLNDELPTIASINDVGLVKVPRDNSPLSIDENGNLILDTESLQLADTDNHLKGIVDYESETVTIDEGKINVITENLEKASESTYGIVKIDNNTIKVNAATGKLYVDTNELNITVDPGTGDPINLDDYCTLNDLTDPDTGLLTEYLLKSEAESIYLQKEDTDYQNLVNTYVNKTELSSQSYVTEQFLSNQTYIKEETADDKYAAKLTNGNYYITNVILSDILGDFETNKLATEEYVNNYRYPTNNNGFIDNDELNKVLNNSQDKYLKTSDLQSELNTNYYNNDQLQQYLSENYYNKDYINRQIEIINGSITTATGFDPAVLNDYYRKGEMSGVIGDYLTNNNYVQIGQLPDLSSYLNETATTQLINNRINTFYNDTIKTDMFTRAQLIGTHSELSSDDVLNNFGVIPKACENVQTWVSNTYVSKVQLYSTGYVTHEWLEKAIDSIADGSDGSIEYKLNDQNPGHDTPYGGNIKNSIANKNWVFGYIASYSSPRYDVNQDTDYDSNYYNNYLPRLSWVKSYMTSMTLHHVHAFDQYVDLNRLPDARWVESYVHSYINNYLDERFDDNTTNDIATYIASIGWVRSYINQYNEKDSFAGEIININSTDLASLNWAASYTASYVQSYINNYATKVNPIDNNEYISEKLARAKWVGSYVSSYINTYISGEVYGNVNEFTDTNKKNKLTRETWVGSYVGTYINTYSTTPNELYSDTHLNSTNRDKLARIQWVGSYINTYITNWVDGEFNGNNNEYTGQNKNKIPTTYWVAGYVKSSVTAMNSQEVSNQIAAQLGPYVTQTSLDGQLSNYVPKPSSTTYVTQADLNTASYASNAALTNLQATVNIKANQSDYNNLSTTINSLAERSAVNIVIDKVNEIIKYLNGESGVNPPFTELTQLSIPTS